MYSFTRNYIDSVAEKAIFQIPILKLVPLTNEDIVQYKKDFKDEKFRSYVPKKSLPPKPLSKKLKMQKERKEVSKLVLSEKVEIDQFKSHFKSVENSQKNQNSSPPLTSISPVGSNNIESMIITSDENIESISFNSPIGTINICDFKTLMNDAMYKRYVRLFLQNNTNNLINNNLINIVTPDIPLNTLFIKNISSNNTEGQIQWVIAKASNGSYQPIPVSFDKRPPKIARNNFNSSKDVCNFNTFLAQFTNSLKKPPVPCESVVSKAIAPEINVDTRRTLANGTIAPKLSVIPPITLADSSMTQATTLTSCKSAIQNIKNIPSTSIQKINGNKIIIGNKQFKLVKGPSRTVSSETNNNNYKTPQNSQKPLVPIVMCYAKNCKSNATIMCSTCTSVKYCSKKCQRQDWFDSHINNCQNLLKLRQIGTAKK